MTKLENSFLTRLETVALFVALIGTVAMQPAFIRENEHV